MTSQIELGTRLEDLISKESKPVEGGFFAFHGYLDGTPPTMLEYFLSQEQFEHEQARIRTISFGNQYWEKIT